MATCHVICSQPESSVENPHQRILVEAPQRGVTLISEMDLFLRNGRNGDFFTKWSNKKLNI